MTMAAAVTTWSGREIWSRAHWDCWQQTTIDYGGGAEVEQRARSRVSGAPVQRWEFAPRGFFEVGRRNIGGKNRSMNLYTRFGLRPNGDPEDSNLFGFSEYRIVGSYREPRALGNYGDLTGIPPRSNRGFAPASTSSARASMPS